MSEDFFPEGIEFGEEQPKKTIEERLSDLMDQYQRVFLKSPSRLDCLNPVEAIEEERNYRIRMAMEDAAVKLFTSALFNLAEDSTKKKAMFALSNYREILETHVFPKVV